MSIESLYRNTLRVPSTALTTREGGLQSRIIRLCLSVSQFPRLLDRHKLFASAYLWSEIAPSSQTILHNTTNEVIHASSLRADPSFFCSFDCNVKVDLQKQNASWTRYNVNRAECTKDRIDLLWMIFVHATDVALLVNIRFTLNSTNRFSFAEPKRKFISNFCRLLVRRTIHWTVEYGSGEGRQVLPQGVCGNCRSLAFIVVLLW